MEGYTEDKASKMVFNLEQKLASGKVRMSHPQAEKHMLKDMALKCKDRGL